MPLTARKVETAGPGKYVDGRGLMLVVKETGAKSWVLRYQHDGRRRDVGLGPWPEVTLAAARERTIEIRRLVREGGDPVAAKRRAKATRFRDAADELVASKRDGWRNAKHAAQWMATLETYAHPKIGTMDVRAVGVDDVLAVLKPIWSEKPETASRVRQRIEAVLDYAAAKGLRDGDNPARWRGHLDHLLPRPSKVKAVEHHAAVDWREIGAFMTALAGREGIAARALAFAILTAARSGEVRGLRWSEIDIDAGIWTVPAARMKAEKEHRVPLTPQALAMLGDKGEPGDLVFPGERKGKPLSDMSLSAVLRRMGRAETVHGFRSTFRDWAGEASSFPREVIEAALAHRLKDKAEAAYARGDLFSKRRALMEAWANIVYGAESPNTSG
ncbi:MAG: integrase arm-type DNA-binding domain-containing protein [Thalassobaculum sp.]|uniref:tyrosine-type recombinase/integrase n=1 Tax=Thalassobaculum sp. TaxID=2022740 RepID=UPI0032EF11D0